MEYYPIKPVGGDSGGGILLAAAHIVRVADAYCASNNYVTILRGCELVNQSGAAFELDGSTGMVSIPEGARTARFTIWQYAGGNSRDVFVRLRADNEPYGLCFRRDLPKAYISFNASRDVSEFSEVGPVIYFKDGGFTFPESDLYGDLGMVEFFS
jgi:hypothetical protein